MGIDQIGLFMDALAQIESGDSYVYEEGDRFGRYGMRRSAWDDLAAFAGIPGAEPTDPRAQDKVAGTAIAELYKRYGDWSATAAAWLGGTKVGDFVAENGWQNMEGVTTDDGVPVSEYARTILAGVSAEARLETPDRSQVQLRGEGIRDRAQALGRSLVTTLGHEPQGDDEFTRDLLRRMGETSGEGPVTEPAEVPVEPVKDVADEPESEPEMPAEGEVVR